MVSGRIESGWLVLLLAAALFGTALAGEDVKEEEVDDGGGGKVKVTRKRIDRTKNPSAAEDMGDAQPADLTKPSDKPATTPAAKGPDNKPAPQPISGPPVVTAQPPATPPPVAKLLKGGGSAVTGGLTGSQSAGLPPPTTPPATPSAAGASFAPAANPRTGNVAGVTALAPCVGGDPRPEEPIAKTVLGLSGVATFLDKDKANLPDMVVAWLEDAGGKPQAKCAALFNLLEVGGFDNMGKAQDVALPAGAQAKGVGLAAGKLPGAKGDTLFLVFIEKVNENLMVRYKVGSEIGPDGAAKWGEAVATPLIVPATVADITAAAGPVSGEGKLDLVVAWLEKADAGAAIKYAIGSELDAKGATAKWSQPMPVEDSGKKLAAEKPSGVAASLAQVTLNPHPDLLISTVLTGGQTNTLYVLNGLNVSPEGKPQRWANYEMDLGVKAALGAGLAVAAVTDRAEGTDLAVFYTEQTDKGAFANLAYLNNPALCPEYKPKPEDLKTVGDKLSGFSKAAVTSQVAAGIKSPFQLKMRVQPYMEKVKTKDEAVQAINKALGEMQPAIPEDVKPELTQHLLKAFGFGANVGL